MKIPDSQPLMLGDELVNFLTPKEIESMLENSTCPIDLNKEFNVPVGGQAPIEHESKVLNNWSSTFGENEYAMILNYIQKFLGKPHPELGRKGPVCPFVPVAARKNTLYLSVVKTTENAANDIETFL